MTVKMAVVNSRRDGHLDGRLDDSLDGLREGHHDGLCDNLLDSHFNNTSRNRIQCWHPMLASPAAPGTLLGCWHPSLPIGPYRRHSRIQHTLTNTEEADDSEQRLLTRNIGTLKKNTKIHNW